MKKRKRNLFKLNNFNINMGSSFMERLGTSLDKTLTPRGSSFMERLGTLLDKTLTPRVDRKSDHKPVSLNDIGNLTFEAIKQALPLYTLRSMHKDVKDLPYDPPERIMIYSMGVIAETAKIGFYAWGLYNIGQRFL